MVTRSDVRIMAPLSLSKPTRPLGRKRLVFVRNFPLSTRLDRLARLRWTQGLSVLCAVVIGSITGLICGSMAAALGGMIFAIGSLPVIIGAG